MVRATCRFPVPASPTISTGVVDAAARRTWSSSRRCDGPNPTKLSNPYCFWKLPPDLEQLDVEPVRLRIGNARLARRPAHPPRDRSRCRCSSRNGQNSRRCQIARRRRGRSTPGSRRAGRPTTRAADGSSRPDRPGLPRGRSVGLTGQPHHRLGRMSGQLFPGPIHPGQLERRVEPEDRLARLLPELFRLEWGTRGGGMEP